MASVFESSIGITADPKTNAVRWNEQWEYSMRQAMAGKIISGIMEYSRQHCEDMEGTLSDHRQQLHNLCNQQQSLSTNAASCFAVHDFESKWLESTIAVRKRHIVEGLVRTCTDHGMEESRLSCPEMTLDVLQSGGGRGYLDMLKYFMIDVTSATALTTPIILSNPRWDKMMGKGRKDIPEHDKILQAYYDGIRNVFICESRMFSDYMMYLLIKLLQAMFY